MPTTKTFSKQRKMKLLAMIICLCINALGSGTIAFPYSIAQVSGMHPTPITPYALTFSIWMLIFAQWIYDFIQKKDTLTITDYALNGLWVIFFCNNYVGVSYIIILAITVRLLMKLPQQTLYATWICVGSTINAYIIGGYGLFFLNILICTIIANPWRRLVNSLEEMFFAIHHKKNPIKPLIPAIISFAVFFWAVFGIYKAH